MSAPKHLAALFSGALFGVGLYLSGMIDPARVQSFLDVAGRWDPSLILVMGGAVLVTFFLFPPILRRSQPVFAAKFHLPQAKHIDGKLIVGAALFGIGWGMAGFCPGPALFGLAAGSPAAIWFVLAMLAGMALEHTYQRLRSSLRQ